MCILRFMAWPGFEPVTARMDFSVGSLTEVDSVKVCADFLWNPPRNTPVIGEFRFYALKHGFEPVTATYTFLLWYTYAHQQCKGLCQISPDSAHKHACYWRFSFLGQRSLWPWPWIRTTLTRHLTKRRKTPSRKMTQNLETIRRHTRPPRRCEVFGGSKKPVFQLQTRTRIRTRDRRARNAHR